MNKYSIEGELDVDSTDSKLRLWIFCDAFRAFSERVLSSRALALDFTRVLNLTRVATLSKASLSMVMAFMSIDCDSLSSLPPLSSSRVPNFYTL